MNPNELINKMMDNYNLLSIDRDSQWRQVYLGEVRQSIRQYEDKGLIMVEERKRLSKLEQEVRK